MKRFFSQASNLRLIAMVLLALAGLMARAEPALALKAIEIGSDQGRVEITTLGELYESRGDSLQVETAAGADGLAGRMSVDAVTSGTNPNWVVVGTGDYSGDGHADVLWQNKSPESQRLVIWFMRNGVRTCGRFLEPDRLDLSEFPGPWLVVH